MRILRRLAGCIWCVVWVVILHLISDPWRDLGGLVSERLRWLEWFVLGAGLLTGSMLGSYGRYAARRGTGRSHAGLLRYLLYPVGLATALSVVLLHLLGSADLIGIVVTASLAYWAGCDLSFAALPLSAGRSYSFTGPIDIESASDPSAEPDRLP